RSCSEDELHGNIGFLNLVTPLIEEKRKIWTEQEAKYKATVDSLSSQLSLSSKPRIFLEGLSDKAVINRMLEYFGKNNDVYIDTSDEDNNSANSASDRAKAFHLLQKHAKEKIQGLLLLDDDEAGKSATRNFTDFFAGQTSMVQAATYPPSDIPKILIKKGYIWKVELEHLYPESIWQYAFQQSWIEFIADEEQKFTDCKRKELFNHEISPLTYKTDLTDYQKFIVDYSFTHDGKRRVSLHIGRMTDDELEKFGLVSAFTPVINLIIKALKL
ncbi:MAG: hypothetical protein ACRDCT_23880, partial [Shewanella sp.]